MRDVAIIGVGRTEFKEKGYFSEEGGNALKEAYLDVKGRGKILAIEDIDIAYFGCTTNVGNAGQMALENTNMLGIGVFNIDNGFVTGTQAFYNAWRDVASGLHDIVIAFGAGSMKPGTLTVSEGGQGWQFGELAKPSPYTRMFAQLARRYMKEYKISKEILAKIAVKNLNNGLNNPKALRKEEVTLEKVLQAKIIAEPLTEYMCAPNANGGVALILAPADHGKYYSKYPIKIEACALTSGKPGLSYLESAYDALRRATQEAFRQVGDDFSIKDIDIAQIYDGYTITEIIGMEALGFCEKGEAAKLIEQGSTELNGEIPINTDGGVLSNGFVLGTSDLAQIVENVLQLQGRANGRQVKKKIRYALSSLGGSAGSGFCGGIAGKGFGIGGGYAVTILSAY